MTAVASALVAAALSVAGCSGDAPSDPAAGGDDVLAASTFQGSASTVDGGTFDLGELAGQDLVIWFWAPW